MPPTKTTVTTTTKTSTPTLPDLDKSLLEALEASLLARGCIVPIVVASDGTILDGRSRELIGKKHKIYIPRVVVGNLDKQDKVDIRLALNGIRRQLSREAWREIIAYEIKRTPNASNRAIGARIGISHPTIGKERQALGKIYQVPVIGKDGKTYPSTRKPIVITSSDRSAREAAEILEEMGHDLPGKHTTFRHLRFASFEADRGKKTAAAKPVKLGEGIDIIACDFTKLGKRVLDNSASMAMLDPPWGVSDSAIRQPLAETAYRLVKPGGYAAIYTGVVGVADFCRVFESAGWVYRWTIACDRDRSRYVPAGRSIIGKWVPILIFQKPPGSFVPPGVIADRIASTDFDKDIHKWGQPANESRLMVLAFSSPGDLVIDLTCGGGSSGVGTIQAGGRRRYFGCDVDKQMIMAARARVERELRK